MLFLGKIIFGEEITEENIFILPLKANIIPKKMFGNIKIHSINSSLIEAKAKGHITSYKQIGIDKIERCKGV